MRVPQSLKPVCLLCAVLWLLLPSVVDAQFTFTNNNGALILTGYTGSGGNATIPAATNGLPVVGIGRNAFLSCPGLTSIVIPATVTNYAWPAFENCTNLLAVYFQGNAPKDFFPGAPPIFDRDTNATLYYLQGTTGWNSSLDALPTVLWNPQILTHITFVTNNGALTITSNNGASGSVVIPNTINGLPVYCIGSNAFFNCATLASITIPKTVTNIGNFAFANCPALASITNPNNVTGIGVFSNCTALNGVIIPKTVTSIGRSEFSACTALISVTIGSSVTNIGDWAFQDCYNLNSVYFQGIPPAANSTVFDGDNNVTNYYLPKSPGWGLTFAGRPTAPVLFTYTNLNGAITITTYIGTGGPVVIPDTINGLPVTTIGVNAFASSSVTSVTIPNTVTNIGVQAFAYCYSLTNITIANSVSIIGNRAFYACYRLSGIVIPDNVGTIQEATFAECTNLTTVVIGNGVTTIQDLAFDYCYNLTSIAIGSGVSSIEGYAFFDCTNLTGIYFKGDAPSVSPEDVFDYDTNATVYFLPGTTGWGTTLDGLPTAVWQPLIQTANMNFGMQSNQFGFNITWGSGMVVVVEACTNLANPGWFPIATNTLTGGSFHFSDPQWTNSPARIYRLRSP